jgi:hypothetical protein
MIYRVFVICLLYGSLLSAQTLELRVGSGQTAKQVVEVAIGEEFALAIWADLAAIRAAGIGFYLALPTGFFAVDRERPFVQGALFAGAVEFANEVMPRHEAIGVSADIELLPYAAVVGPRSERGREGRGQVAHVILRPLRSGWAHIAFVHSPIYPGKLVVDDGVGERFFYAMEGIDIVVRSDHSPKAAADKDKGWAALKRRISEP